MEARPRGAAAAVGLAVAAVGVLYLPPLAGVRAAAGGTSNPYTHRGAQFLARRPHLL